MGEVANEQDGECEQSTEAEQTDRDVSVVQTTAAERRCGISLGTDGDPDDGDS